MFFKIFLFEIRYRLKMPATYIYFALFFIFAFFIEILAGGAFDSINFVMNGASGKIFAGSSITITQYTFMLNYLGIIIITAMVANPVYRDFEYNAHSLFFTKPISKWDYLGGRFLGSCIVAIFSLSGVTFGLMLGSLMPFVKADYVGPFHFINFLHPYLTVVIPNLLFIGMIFFMLATLTRNMLTVYIGSVILMVLLGVAGSLEATLKNEFMAGLLDPTGGKAINYVTKYWTVGQKNSNPLLLTGAILYNRLIWMGVAAGLFVTLFIKFKFEQFSSEWRVKKNAKTILDKAGAYVATAIAVHQNFSMGTQIKQYIRMTWLELRNILRSPYFLAIVFVGLVLMFVSGWQFGKMYDTNTYPVTGIVATGMASVFGLCMIIIIIFYSGEMIWKERELKISNIYDALPVSGWVNFTSKLTALILLQVVLLTMVMVCSIITQACFGYFHFEIPVYLETLFGIVLIKLALFCAMALFIQTLTNQKYLGFFIVIVYYLINSIFLDSMGFSHNLYKYAAHPAMQYSAMNGFGYSWTGYFWFTFYWACFAVMLAIVANLFWVRGVTDGSKARLKLARARFKGAAAYSFVGALVLFVLSGSYIFYNTNILNHYTTANEDEKESVEYEKKYKKYDHLVQPRIIAMDVNADIYPEKRAVNFNASYILKNKSNKPIDSIHVLINSDVRKHIITFAGYPDSIQGTNDDAIEKPIKHKLAQALNAVLVSKDSANGYYIYRLPSSLLPGDSLKMDFALDYAAKGFTNEGGDNAICYNGTFLNNAGYLPNIGYSEAGELGDNMERKKFGLPYKEPMAPLGDTNAVKNNLVSTEADWIRYQAVLSTEGDQTAITSGDLVKKWKANDRNYFEYKSPSKILCFVPFVSARYEVKQDTFKGVQLSIYYNKGHEYNLDRMMNALKDGLTYYTKNYSPYQFKQVKIVEFPYASFAQSFANTIPFSENIGFIADVKDDDPEDIDYPYYVTAHELGHQWWAHQVIGGKVQGVTMLDETMAQYSALMVMKHRYGADKMKKFLRYEMDKYLSARGFEREKELPLYRVEGQSYVYYRKGSVVMYNLQDNIGEYKLDSALHRYIQRVAFEEPPYTTSIEFLKYVSQAVPDSMNYLITDMFKTITIFNNKVTTATYKKEKDSTYLVHITVEAHKLKADSLGNEKEVALNDWINIGVFGQPESGSMKPMYMKRMKITASTMSFDVEVKGKPYEAGIDPYNELIDRMPEDNIKTLDEAK